MAAAPLAIETVIVDRSGLRDGQGRPIAQFRVPTSGQIVVDGFDQPDLIRIERLGSNEWPRLLSVETGTGVAVGEVQDAEDGPAFLLEAVNDYGIVAANELDGWMLVTAEDPHAGWLARDGNGRMVVHRSQTVSPGLGLLVLALAMMLQLGLHGG